MPSPLATQFDDDACFPKILPPPAERPMSRPPGLGRLEHKLDVCDGMIDIAAALFNVSGKDLRKPGRGSLGVCRVRQIAMYVAHVALGLTMGDVGRGFGRDRTTVLYACHLVEDMRDDRDFDHIVAATERIALAAFRAGGRI